MSHSEADMALCCLLAFWTGGGRTPASAAPGGLQVSRRRSPEARRRETASPESTLVEPGQYAGLVRVSNRSSHAEKHESVPSKPRRN
ncbi:hypothetical protein C9J85_18670 [Haloferax sp. wsp5]|nr:hypothetical protein C9J85_18670 [Haloferax sp. wsp5]